MSHLCAPLTPAQLHGVCAVVQVKQLAAEVVAHLRETVGADALLEAFNAARQSVTSLRAERKRQAAVKVSKVHSASSLDVLEGFKGVLGDERNCQEDVRHCTTSE